MLAVIPSNQVAQWLLVHIHHLLDLLGLKREKTIEDIIYVAIIVCVALFLGWVIRKIILWATKIIMRRHHNDLVNRLVQQHVLTRCSHIIPPIVILALLPFAFTSQSIVRNVVMRGVLIYTVIVICMAFSSIASFIWCRFNEERNSKNLPLKGILDTIIGILWFICIIVCVAIIVGRSPAALLTGLGAFAAVLMLVFKDSILGLVAGLQLSQNDMLRVGDWIVVPSTPANGIVMDVTLTAVKVQNFDNTIITLPPYTLISTSFQNWRGMTDSGCRLISRNVIIDTDTVKAATPEYLAGITATFPELKSYIEEVQKLGHPDINPGVAVVNGTVDTNLGVFRAYLCQWLLANQFVNHEQQILVRIMTPTGEGMPLQVYCYTATTAWTAYEAIQSAIFEHVAVMAPKFGLRLFCEPSGTDVTSVRVTTSPAIKQ